MGEIQSIAKNARPELSLEAGERKDAHMDSNLVESRVQLGSTAKRRKAVELEDQEFLSHIMRGGGLYLEQPDPDGLPSRLSGRAKP